MTRRSGTSVVDAVEEVRSAAGKLKVPQFEAYAYSRRSRRVVLERGRVSGADTAHLRGLHVRVSVGGRVGGAFCNRFEAGPVTECVGAAVRVARLMEPDPGWCGFPSCDRAYRQVSGIHDESVASLDMAVMAMMAEEMADAALSVSKEVSVPFGTVESVERSVAVANSSGIDSVMTETELQAGVNCVAGSGSSISPDCEARGMSRTCDLRMDRIGERAGWVADKSIRLVSAKTEETEVVFSPHSLGYTDSGLLSLVLSKAFSGQSVNRNVSFLAERVGDAIWSDDVTLTDNPLLSGRCGTRPFDDEGVPTRRTNLVDKGVLKGFVWDSYNGAASGTGSTGNAVRDMSSGAVGASTLCLNLAPGRGTMDSLIESVDHGYLVWACQGAHTSDMETGGFSFVASPGLLIENGEVVGGVRGVMLSGTVDDLMARVERVGSDVTDFGGALMPSVLFRDVKVTTG